MKVLNIMLSRRLGGIEQSFLDYNKALAIAGQEVYSVISNKAEIQANISDYSFKLPNYFQYDPISIFKLSKIINQTKAEIIIAHGNRAINAAIYAKELCGRKLIIISVAHNFKTKCLVKCDYIFSITNYFKAELAKTGFDINKIFFMPNVIDTKLYDSDFIERVIKKEDETVIGSMGRFVDKKGFDLLIKALDIVKKNGYKFKAIIGGDGILKKELQELTTSLDLNSNINFCGWVNNKSDFLNGIDIFCLPSKEEPFGIVLIEAMFYGKAIVSTNTEGPSEIINNNEDGLLTNNVTAEQIATKIQILLNDVKLRNNIGKKARLSIFENYDINIAAKKLKNYLEEIKQNEF